MHNTTSVTQHTTHISQDGRKVVRYTDEERELFIETASDIGLRPAVEKLGYPSPEWGLKWLREAGVDVKLDALAVKAANMRHFYTHNEQLYVLNQLLAEISERLEDGMELSTDDIEKLQRAVAKNVESQRLITGEVTSRIEHRIDTDDIELLSLVERAQLAVQGRREAIEATVIEDATVIEEEDAEEDDAPDA